MLNQTKFIIKSLRYFSKQHIAVFLATLISSAVLTGALIVGDSVKYSLNNLVNKRLGNIEYALLTGDRFVRSQLAIKISNDLNIPTASMLMLQGIAINTENQKRINKAQLVGVDNSFWMLSNIAMPELVADEVIISKNIAEKLSLNIGSELLLRIQNADVIPLNSPFTTDEDHSVAMRVTIKAIADDNNLGRFSFRNNQSAPYNIFINRDLLAEKLELTGLSNIIIAARNEYVNESALNYSLRKNWTLIDAGLKINHLDSSGTLDLISQRIFINSTIADKVSGISVTNEKLLTYFVNSFRYNDNETPYSFVTAASNSFLGEQLTKSEIIINSWLAEDLNIVTGDTLEIEYFVIGPLRTLNENAESFVVKKIIPNLDNYAYQALMPDFPGLSDAGNCSEWDAGIPIDLKKIRDKDEHYWTDFKGTPKAFISMEKGMELWDNKFGNYTSIRFDAENISKAELEKVILATIDPKDINLMFIDVRSDGVRAASSGVDFGELFLSLSFFVIASAILLTVLIYSLNLENRKHEVGVMFALGFTKRQILRLRFSESLPTIILSSIIGGLAGILYNKAMISGLNSVWNDAIHADMLEIYIVPKTITIGIIIGIIISLLSIYIVTARRLKKSIISTIQNQADSHSLKKSRFSKIIAVIGILGSIGLVLFSVSGSIENNTSLTLTGGLLFLVGSTSLVSIMMNTNIGGKDSVKRILNFWHLVIINTGRNKGRSIAVIALLAIGTFTIILTGANRLTFSGTENQRKSGTGGYKLWVENTLPLLQNLNTEEGKKHYGLENESVLDNVSFVQFHNLPGDDASCLNLNQVQRPQILGINSNIFDSLQAFSFAKLLTDYKNPWLELNNNYGPNIIPAIADQTIIQWGIMKSIGDTLTYFNEFGKELKLILIGGLNSSVFQGNILISEKHFMNNFPGSSGSKIMLVDVPEDDITEVEGLLTNYLTDYGIEINSASKRLADFYSVTNTYLTIFMILGGLGVILGTFGLGIVLMRNMIERKHEIAIFEALGFKKVQIFKLIFTENLFLLLAGIIIGFLSAIIGILPSLLSPAFHIPGNFLFILVSIVFISGLLWIYIPTRLVLKEQLLENLRKE